MIKKCLNCGKEFNAPSSRRKFCSRECLAEYYSKHPVKVTFVHKTKYSSLRIPFGRLLNHLRLQGWSRYKLSKITGLPENTIKKLIQEELEREVKRI